MTHHEHHEHEGGVHGVALGFRIFESEGDLYLAEVEVSAYVDAPQELGATLVFHPLKGVDPTTAADEEDWPTWAVDIDDELTRAPGDLIPQQFQAIARQVSELSREELEDYLRLAREESEGEG